MHGLIFEWCADYYHPTYDGAPTDGSAWMAHDDNDYYAFIVRGGTWNDDPSPDWCNRAASRDGALPHERLPDIGFRVARTCVEL